MATSSAALSFAHSVLRVLIVLNWLFGVGVLAILVATVVAEAWTFTALGFASADVPKIAMALRAIPVLGLVAVPLNDLVLRRLRAIVETVRGRDPFVAANAVRLQAIAWALVALQFVSIAVGFAADAVSSAAAPLHVDAGFSITGWLAVLLTFVLARVFAEGSRMRDDLEGTV